MLLKEKVAMHYHEGRIREGMSFAHPRDLWWDILKVRDPGRWGPAYVDIWIQMRGGTPQWITLQKPPARDACCLTV